MAEHLDAHRPAGGACDTVAHDGLVDVVDLLERQFTRHDHDVGHRGIVAHGLGVANVDLRGDVYLDAYRARIGDCRHVAGDDGAHASLAGSVDDAAHIGHVLVVDDGVDREVTLHAALLAPLCYGVKVVDGEVDARLRPHVQALDAEVDGIGTGLPSRRERLPRAYGSHYFKVAALHSQYFPVSIPLMSLSLLSASMGVRLLMSVCRISSRICVSTGSSSWKMLN